MSTPYRDPWLRFMEKVVKDAAGCWLWQAHLGWQGYGWFWTLKQRSQAAHRWAWEQINGPVPDGLQLDHLCRVRRCVNPDHLDLVTPRENLMRGDTLARRNAEATHCIHGHEFTPSNTYRPPDRNSRQCRACRNNNSRRCAAKKKELV